MFASLTLITTGALAAGGWGYYQLRQSDRMTPTDDNGAAGNPPPEEQKGFIRQVTEPIKRLQFYKKKEDNSPQQFLSWVKKESGSVKLATWLNHLSEEALVALTHEVSAFCIELGVDLKWLLEHQLDQEPELKQSIKKIVLNYLSACRQAAHAWDDMAVFMILREFESDLPNKKYKEQHGQLYTKLVENKLASPAPPELLLASEEKIYSYMIQEIRKAIQTNRKAFKRVLKEFLTSLNG